MTTLHRREGSYYECGHSRADHVNTPACRSVKTTVVDELIARRLLEALAPEEIALALAPILVDRAVQLGADLRSRRMVAVMAVPARLSVSTCVGCGSMREFATCDGICREEKLELASVGDYEELAAAGARARLRIEALLPLVTELAGPVSPGPEPPARYAALRERARLLLHANESPARDMSAATASAATVVVWRCPDCGGLEETQPCIGVCIWRPAYWVSLDAFESTRAQVLQDIESERVLSGLVTRFAWVRPRDGEWEQNWRAFQAQARRALEGQVLTA